MILLIGSLGNMGRRYAAILRHLNLKFVGYDLKMRKEDQADFWLEGEVHRSYKVIVAVPTRQHLETLRVIDTFRFRTGRTVDVLCEKPIVKTKEDLAVLRQLKHLQIFSVNQYAHLPEYRQFRESKGRTYYNYFKHGDDGLPWDCFQLFALASGNVALSDQSPLWKCKINGVDINPRGMDGAYISMVSDFAGPMLRTWDLFSTEMTTTKVLQWMAEEEQDIIESSTRN